MNFFILKKPLLFALLIMCGPPSLYAYSVLTHEAIIDATWDKTIQPLLVAKYPGSTADQLKEAHAYAYGGCVAPDMGYYPFGSKDFTNLVHYVRTGDFVNALLNESQNINEYAFALGVLCHYYADKYGHPIATNRCVPIVYAKDRKRYGGRVTYEQDPVSHIRVEFGFDVIQTARGSYASEKYHDFIGFKVARPVLERAFLKTYGIDINGIFKDFSLSVETFRWTVKNFMPTITKAAWAAKKSQIRKLNNNITRRKFEYKMRKANYYHEYGQKREKTGVFPTAISVIVRVIPKVGPLRDLKIKIPGPEAENLFIKSFDTVVIRYSLSLTELNNKNNKYPNIDFDTGNETVSGEYNMADENYIVLLLRLKDNKFKNVDADLKENIMKFYGRCNEKLAAKAGAAEWQQITTALNQLNAFTTN